MSLPSPTTVVVRRRRSNARPSTLVTNKQLKKRLKSMLCTTPSRYQPKVTPPPMRVSNEVYLQRRIRISKVQTTNDPIEITSNDVNAALYYAPASGQAARLRICNIAVWNTTNSTNSTNYVSVTPNGASLAYSGVDMGDYYDRGCGGVSASVGVELPKSLTTLVNATKGSTTSLISVSAIPSDFDGLSVNSQHLVVDMLVEVRY